MCTPREETRAQLQEQRELNEALVATLESLRGEMMHMKQDTKNKASLD